MSDSGRGSDICSGYVYVLQFSEDQVKIGKTARDPQERAGEWDLPLLHYTWTEDCDWAEREAHRRLDASRHGSYEVFSVPLDIAIATVNEVCAAAKRSVDPPWKHLVESPWYYGPEGPPKPVDTPRSQPARRELHNPLRPRSQPRPVQPPPPVRGEQAPKVLPPPSAPAASPEIGAVQFLPAGTTAEARRPAGSWASYGVGSVMVVALAAFILKPRHAPQPAPLPPQGEAAPAPVPAPSPKQADAGASAPTTPPLQPPESVPPTVSPEKTGPAPQPETAAPPTTGEKMFTTVRLNVRAQPDLASRSLRMLEPGVAITALERAGDWAPISDGWVSLRYLTSESRSTTGRRESGTVGSREGGLW